MFYFAVATLSAAWIMAFPLVFFTGAIDPLRVVIYFLIPGAAWLIIRYERREDAKDKVETPAPC